MKFAAAYFTFILMAVCIFSSCKEKAASTKAINEIDSVHGLNSNPYVKTDQSPMDMCWLPANYPVEKMKGNDTQKLVARVIYSRPHKKNRVIFGSDEKSLCIYGKPWRLGANEATEIDLFQNVNIAGTNIPKGTYVMYCIPHPDRWTIILNSNLYTWGLHINQSSDFFQTDVPVREQSPALEDFTMMFQETETGGELLMAWDNVKTTLPLVYSK